MTVKHKLRKFVNRFGIDVSRYPNGGLKNRILAINHFKINSIFDVGANDGGYATELRRIGYTGKIISFEPIKSVFEELKKNAKGDAKWFLENMALGDKDTTSLINVSQNTVSSSILNILPSHYDSAPNSKYVAKEEISIQRLDSIFNNHFRNGDNVLLKIDTQGYERFVLEGAESCFDLIKGIQLEMSLIPLYENSILFDDMIEYMREKGFYLYNIENGFVNKSTGQQLQVDGTFFRNG